MVTTTTRGLWGKYWYADVDGDGYGNPAESRLFCDPDGVYNESDDDDRDDGDLPSPWSA